jgi:hypothetical protein
VTQFLSNGDQLGEPFGSSPGQGDETPLDSWAAAESSRRYYGSWLPFLLELSAAAAGFLPLGFHRGELSLGDGRLVHFHWFAFESFFFANYRGRVAAGNEIG